MGDVTLESKLSAALHDSRISVRSHRRVENVTLFDRTISSKFGIGGLRDEFLRAEIYVPPSDVAYEQERYSGWRPLGGWCVPSVIRVQTSPSSLMSA